MQRIGSILKYHKVMEKIYNNVGCYGRQVTQARNLEKKFPIFCDKNEMP